MPVATAAIPDTVATLTFDPGNLVIGDVDLRQGLSAIALHGDDLWLACDEGCRLERLARSGPPGIQFASHASVDLSSLLDLPAPDTEEADVEGLDVDGGFLWLVGSHSVKRKKPKSDDSVAKISEKLAKTERDGNRHLLARIPFNGRDLARVSGSRRAGTIATTPESSALLEALETHEDPHLLPFIEIPGKDNGLDIEGLAVRDLRAFVGLRGPVLREWCCLLELRLAAGASGALDLTPFEDGVPYRKHFLKLGGLGLRDLVWLDDDLLMLAGPAMAHDGPIEIWRWKNAAAAGGSTIDARRVLTLPHGEGNDRAEGFTLLGGPGAPSVLVVFDSPSDDRLDPGSVGPSGLKADVYRLP